MVANGYFWLDGISQGLDGRCKVDVNMLVVHIQNCSDLGHDDEKEY